MNAISVLVGFLILFLLYQLAEANGLDLIDLPGKPYSILLLFFLVIPAAYLVARRQGDNGLASYGMGLSAGWWQNYLCGLGFGLPIQTILELIGIQFGVRKVTKIHFSWRAFLSSILWVLFTNLPAAAGEDLVTRGYLWRFRQTSPTMIFVLFSALVYTMDLTPPYIMNAMFGLAWAVAVVMGVMIPPCQIIFSQDFSLNRFAFILGI
jgi:hypothetical protein